jgi:hypothetical protein
MIPTACFSAVFGRLDYKTAEFLLEIIPPTAGLKQVVG